MIVWRSGRCGVPAGSPAATAGSPATVTLTARKKAPISARFPAAHPNMVLLRLIAPRQPRFGPLCARDSQNQLELRPYTFAVVRAGSLGSPTRKQPFLRMAYQDTAQVEQYLE